MPREFLTVVDLADELGLKPKTVRNRMYDGTWRRGEHWFSRPGIGPRFKWSAIVRWLESGDAGQGRDDGLAYGPDIPRDRTRGVALTPRGAEPYRLVRHALHDSRP